MNEMSKTLNNIFLILGAFFVILILFLIHLMSNFLVPIFIAFFTAFLLQPFIKKLQKKMPSWLATLIVIILSVLFLSSLIFIIFLYLQRMLHSFPTVSKDFQKNIMFLIDTIADWDIVNEYLSADRLKTLIYEFFRKINFSTYMISTMTKTLVFFKDFIFFIIALIFILPGMNRISIRIARAFPQKSEKINRIIFNVMDQIQKYIFVKSIVSFFIGLSIALICIIFNIKYALLWGFIIFLFHFIPYLGAFTSVSIIGLYSLIQYQNPVLSLILICIVTVCYLTFSEILEPKFQSIGVNLSPIIIFTSLFVWGYILGIAGVFLAVPIMSAFNVICENIEALKPINRLISSKKRIKKINDNL
jgi:AI-2 transport protein TqsA